MSVLAVILFGLCVTSVWAECGTCDKTSQCTEEPAASDCEFGLVKDACNCCSQCAKGVGETCGTRNNAGICATGLICKLVSPRQPSRCDEDPDAPAQVVVQEVPADAIQGENIQDEEEGPIRSPSESQSTVGQRTRVDQVQRPLRGQQAQANQEATRENPTKPESDLPAQSKSDAETEVTSQDTPTENNQEQQTPSSSAQDTPQRSNQGLRGNNGQNTRTRGNVPVERVSNAQASQPEETESPTRGTAPGQRVSNAQASQPEETESPTRGIAPGQRVQATLTSTHEATEQLEGGDQEPAAEGRDEHDQINPTRDVPAVVEEEVEAQVDQQAEEEQGKNDQEGPIHTRSEIEETETAVQSNQNRRTEVEETSGPTRGQTVRQTARSRATRQNHNEPTPRHNHEGSIQNLNEEDINENYNHDTPNFDNRTT